jgi:endonuclease/exonuclease/phosphatase family metal-dependent hydrolase
MRGMAKLLVAWALCLAGLVGPAHAQDPAAQLSVLTYNIEGLPAPIAWGRGGAAREIAARLREMRAHGDQPHVVVLQEAFGEAQRAIGREAGYRYVAFGPEADTPAAPIAMTAEDRAFAAQASFFKGERSGKWAGSGLAILSDYPIVAVKIAAFPAFACAGFDCLANKGVLIALVKVPGSAQPIAVVASHLNSKTASGVAKSRWNYAFRRQVDAMGTFLRANLPAEAPYVFAGDTNIGKSAQRRVQFTAMLSGLPRAGLSGIVQTALSTCLDAHGGCALADASEARRAFRHGKDWQVYGAGLDTMLRPIAIRVPFGHDAAGRMLSDHIGYVAAYEIRRFAPAVATALALR